MAIQNVIGGGDGAGLTGTVSGAGTTQATATILLSQDSDVSTVASGSGVVLPTQFSPGEEMTVFNSGANALKVYPMTGYQINALPTNGAMTLSTNTGVMFRCVSTTRIFEKGVDLLPETHYVMPDIHPYQSMIDGTMITSRSQHREHLRQHGCQELGNEPLKAKPYTGIPDANPKGRKELIRAQVNAMTDRQFRQAIKRDVDFVKWNSNH